MLFIIASTVKIVCCRSRNACFIRLIVYEICNMIVEVLYMLLFSDVDDAHIIDKYIYKIISGTRVHVVIRILKINLCCVSLFCFVLLVVYNVFQP